MRQNIIVVTFYSSHEEGKSMRLLLLAMENDEIIRLLSNTSMFSKNIRDNNR